MTTHALPDEPRPRRHLSDGSSLAQRIAKSALVKRLNGLRDGRLHLTDAQGAIEIGSPGELDATLRVLDPEFYTRIARAGSIGAAEAYRDGLWHTHDLVALLRLLVRNRDRLDDMDAAAPRLIRWATEAAHRLRPNSVRGSRRNIAEHYDVSNALFASFLDRRMMYSSAIYSDAGQSLDDASANKIAHIVRKLHLNADDHLLEIGTGWGGLAIYAAQAIGCRVTTITVSGEQHRFAEQAVRDAGVVDLVTVLNRDYRDIDGRYSKLVSVEMVEAVGDGFLDGFFARCDRLLAPGGLMLLQAITIEDFRYHQALRSVDFIKKHIFPGSFIPSVSRLVAASAVGTQLVLTHLEDIGADYARTLQAWRMRFLIRLDRVAELGFDDRFVRLWEFYLAYCEAGFRERSISDVQMLFAKSPYRGVPWRALG